MLFYAGDDAAHGTEPWATDGTATGTGLLGDIHAGPERGLVRGGPGGLVYGVGDRAYFVGSDGRSGDELWAYRVTRP
jgi:ELWxxDGT repeat protein